MENYQNYKGVSWNASDLLAAKQAMSVILANYGEGGLYEALHECSWGNLNTNAVLEEIAPEFVEYLAENSCPEY